MEAVVELQEGGEEGLQVLTGGVHDGETHHQEELPVHLRIPDHGDETLCGTTLERAVEPLGQGALLNPGHQVRDQLHEGLDG